eukprot:CAMPEP_0184490504 /NCGR_PEP_ID=MMETSP0113_2-20130426/18042_1 /TAXON_ID=91329 /ORGANISM="Norrisiella sphaerica, Strain BC52" /LENGTH=338 /DNA_ID=CAMNT_0026874407 /DNA_START=175 /DNA_END=1191 /DNA_ORIENTATION=-
MTISAVLGVLAVIAVTQVQVMANDGAGQNGCNLGLSWQSVKESLGLSTPVDAFFNKVLDDELGRLKDPTAMVEQMMHSQQMDQETVARQEAERLEELTSYHQDNLGRLFDKFKTKEGTIDVPAMYSLLEAWAGRAQHWVPVILLRSTIETVNLAKQQAKAQKKPIPASAKRNFALAKKQIATFSKNFFHYDNPVIVTTDLAERVIAQILENDRLTNEGNSNETRYMDAAEDTGGDGDDKGPIENDGDVQNAKEQAPSGPAYVTRRQFMEEFLNAIHVERIDGEGIMVKLQMFVAKGLRQVGPEVGVGPEGSAPLQPGLGPPIVSERASGPSPLSEANL